MSLVPLLVSPSTSSPLRTTHLHCETATQQSRFAPASMRSSPPSATSSMARSNGQMLLHVCLSSRVRRSMPKLHKQIYVSKGMKVRTEEESQKLGRYPSMFVEGALVNVYEQPVEASRLAFVRSCYTNASKIFDRCMYRRVEMSSMHCCPLGILIRGLT